MKVFLIQEQKRSILRYNVFSVNFIFFVLLGNIFLAPYVFIEKSDLNNEFKFSSLRKIDLNPQGRAFFDSVYIPDLKKIFL